MRMLSGMFDEKLIENAAQFHHDVTHGNNDLIDGLFSEIERVRSIINGLTDERHEQDVLIIRMLALLSNIVDCSDEDGSAKIEKELVDKCREFIQVFAP